MAGNDRQYNLLLVDDNPTNLLLLAKIVEFDLPQVNVLTASNAAEGLALARQQQLDGAFIDVQMPQVSGIDMCRQLKADPQTAGIPLVLVTAHLASPQMRAAGLEVGAYDFISQPISNIEMLARIKVMLRLADSQQSLRQDNRQLQQQIEQHSTQLRWVSGLLLSGDGALAEPDMQLVQRLAAELPEPGEINERQFSEKLTSEFPLPWRRSLMKLALLDAIPLPLARKLSEIADIEAVFTYLQRHDLSLLPAKAGDDRLYFKPLLRDLLRERARRILEPAEQQQVYLQAADWYQQQGAYPVALSCLLRAENYAAVSQLLNQLGLALLDERFQPQLFQVLAEVPEDVAAGCGWLSLFSGLAARQEHPLDTDVWLELAQTRFAAAGDCRGELLALSQQLLQYLLVNANLGSGLHKLPRLRELCAGQLERLDPANRVKVLFSLGMSELFSCAAFSRVEEILALALPEALQQKLLDSQLELHILRIMLAIYQGRLRVGRGALEQAELCAAALSERCLPVQLLAIVSCELLFTCGDLDGFELQRRRAEQLWPAGILQKSAFAPLLSYRDALTRQARGDLSAAMELLEAALLAGPLTYQPHLQSLLLQLRGQLLAQAGQLDKARGDCQRALELRAQVGGVLAELPNLLLAGVTCLWLQELPQAREFLERGLVKSIALAEECCRGGFYAWLALLNLRCGQTERAVELFQQLLEGLRRQQRNFFIALHPQLLRELLPVVCRHSGNTEQLRALAAEWLTCGLADDGRLIPLLELQTLGGFRLGCGGQQFDVNEVGQTSRMILALLSVAPNRALSIEVLMGTLWPDSPTDRARNSFDTAHSRLRKALDARFGMQIRHDYLVLEKGVLALQNIRIDSHIFSLALADGRYHLQRQNFKQAELALWKAQRLWSGEYLAGLELDADLPYRREQLTQFRLEQLGELARLLSRRGDFRQAVQLLQEGLLLEPTDDALVQQLLSLAQQQGEKRLARQVLENYRRALQQADYTAEEIEELTEALSPQRLNLDT